jgi:hypothetical protein
MKRVQRLALVIVGAAALAAAGLAGRKHSDSANEWPTLPAEREPKEWRTHLREEPPDA